jgi:hypothetical protein
MVALVVNLNCHFAFRKKVPSSSLQPLGAKKWLVCNFQVTFLECHNFLLHGDLLLIHWEGEGVFKYDFYNIFGHGEGDLDVDGAWQAWFYISSMRCRNICLQTLLVERSMQFSNLKLLSTSNYYNVFFCESRN